MKIALDTNVLAYAEGINDAARRDAALALIERIPQTSIFVPVPMTVTFPALGSVLSAKLAGDILAALKVEGAEALAERLGPARQSRCSSHQPRQNSRASMEPHQIAGVPSASTSWDHSAPV